MRGGVHHVRVVLRLLGTTRGGLVAMLVLVNCVPMVAMSMFVAGAEHHFAYGYTPETFAFSLLFAPLSRWALGYALGHHAGRSTAAYLPLSPRVRACAEVAAIVLALWVPAVAVTAVAVVVAGMDATAGLGDVVASVASLCAAVSALALPHFMLASLDREAPYTHRIWIRWVAAPTLIALGLAVPSARSLAGYLIVGLGAAAVVVAWGSVSWLGSPRRRPPLAPSIDPRTLARHAPDEPSAALRRDFVRGLGLGAARGILWALALVGPLVVLRWWRFPALATAAVVVVTAAVAGGHPLGLRARVVGGRWSNNGDFARAWSVLPIPRRSLARAVYLHIAACSGVVLVAGAVLFAVLLPRAADAIAVTTTGALVVAVVALALVGIRTHAAVGTRSLWQFSWLAGGSAVASAWLSGFAFNAPEDGMFSAAFGGLSLIAAAVVAFSPMFLLSTRRVLGSTETVPGG